MQEKNKKRSKPAGMKKLAAGLQEAEETLQAIRTGSVDAVVVRTPRGNKVYTLKGAETPYRIIVESMNEGAVTLVSGGIILYANPHFSEMLKIPLERIMGSRLSDFVSAQDRELLPELFAKGMKGSARAEVNLVTSCGDLLPVYLSLRSLPIDKRTGLSTVITDISERKRAEEALRRAHGELEMRVRERTAELKESEERYRVITESAFDAIITIDAESRIVFVNPASERVFGYTPDELYGESLTMLMPERLRQAHLTGVKKHIATGKRYLPWGAVEMPGLHKDGREIQLELSYGEFIKDGRYFFIGIVRDITERKKAEETIKYQAYHDLLTGLPNRAQLMLRFDLELVQARRNQRKLAVLYLDLDRFKVINDSLGHYLGDKVLLAVTDRLKARIRKSDTLARIGSDEFIVMFADIHKAEDAARVTREIISDMRKAFRVNSHDLYVTASIGISMYPEDSEDAEELLTKAHIVMSSVKERGRNSYQFFDPAMNIRTIERLLLESSLRQTLERGELVLYFQPQVSIRTGEVICFEALVRWRHADLGVLLPTQFIPVAEEIGFIPAIDEWVLRTACAQAKALEESGYPLPCVTVNLSAQQFQQRTLVETVAKILQETGLDPRQLGIEISESTAMRDIELAILNLQGLHDMGIQLAIDDFGTGYSSLNYLKRFPVQKLKIDQSFVSGVPADPDDQEIVRAVIAMGHNLKLQIIAEGVETEEQLSFLRDNDCDAMQGFLFSKPLPADEIEKMIMTRK